MAYPGAIYPGTSYPAWAPLAPGQMRTRLVSYVPFGSAGAVLPDALESQIVTPLGELPTAQVHYHRDGVNAVQLDGMTELGFEYYSTLGWVEPPNGRFLSMKGGFDHLEATPTRKYSFVGVGWMLRQAKVWEANGLPVDADGKVQFLSANAGQIMGTLIQNAQGRGWGAGVSIDFDSTADSSGQAWAKIITIAYDLDLDLETVLANLYQQGVCDYRWEGRTLRIFNPETTMAQDLTVGTSPVRLVVNDGQTSAPEEWTNEDLLTHAMVLGEDGKRWEFANGANNPLGRLEQVITQGGVSDEGTASLLAQTDLLAGSETQISFTREFVLTDESVVWPYRTYTLGDWVLAQRGTTFERLRTVSLSLTVNADGVKGHAVLGTRLQDLLTKLAKRTKGITGGTSAGGSGARPAPEGPDNRTPTAPTGLVVAVDAYIGNDGAAQGRADIDWAHDGAATDGTAMTVDAYQVYYRVNELGEVWRQLPAVQDTELAHSPLPLLDDDGTPQEYGFKVRAVADNGRHSAFTPVVVVTMEPDTTPPPVPQFFAEDVSTWLRTTKVEWQGKGLSGATVTDMPRDFSHVNVYRGSSPSGPWVPVDTGAGAGMVHQSREMTADVTVWYALTAVDRSDNESVLSTVQSVTPAANVDLAEITGNIDGAMLGENSIKYVALLASAEMWTRVLGAHKIKAAEADLNSFTSDTGFVGDLEAAIITSTVFQGKEFNGGIFTGPLFQTTSTPFEGLKFDPNGLKAWDNLTGNLTVDIRPSGYAWLSGIVEASIIRGGTVEGAAITTGVGDWRGISIYVDPATGGRDPGVMTFAGSSASGYEAAALRIGEGTNTPFQIFGPQSPLSAARASIYLDTADGVQGSIETRSRFFTAYLEKMIVSGAMDITQRLEVRDNLDVVGGSVSATGNGIFGGNVQASGHSTTSNSANAHMSSSGILYRSTSSIRYKADVQDWEPDYRALGLRPRSWADKNPIDPTAPLERYYGFIAEEVLEILPEMVTFNEYGEPESVTYDRFIAALIPIIRDLHARVTALEPPK